MAKKKKQEQEQPAKSEKMTLEDAKKLAEKFLPKDESKRFEKGMHGNKEVNIDKFDVMYVTSDGTVFYKQNEGSARAHSRERKLELFEVKF